MATHQAQCNEMKQSFDTIKHWKIIKKNVVYMAIKL